ncbi:PREDICTED: cadherin-related hmr-1-like [Priapulus caudatus]|uniref:Cadherin-related hmr-1-like n=1 Tax=Priapulus caudatus TaxID=37621 RepID=A0ABM1EH19_PRICU|nr:PREDICTED: cadherin-related hmr-1-like [Priapulus caudatus]
MLACAEITQSSYKLTVKATDNDSCCSARPSASLSNTVLANITVFQAQTQLIAVQAIDQGPADRPTAPGYCDVIISVYDPAGGERPPVWIDAPAQPIALAENVPQRHDVVQLSVNTRGDVQFLELYGAITNTNADHQFRFTPDDDKDYSGTLRVEANTLDYNTVNVYQVPVRAQDMMSKLKTDYFIPINLVDMNIHEPQFTAAFYNTSVKENITIAEHLYHDPIIQGLPRAHPHSIPPYPGFLTKAAPASSLQEYVLTLTVSDGVHSSDATLTVAVTLENIRPPEFTHKQYNVSTVEEDSSVPSDGTNPKLLYKFAGEVTNNDIVSDRIEFKLSGQGTLPAADPAFRVDPTSGELYMHKPLDRDLPYGQETYTLLVSAQDSAGLCDYHDYHFGTAGTISRCNCGVLASTTIDKCGIQDRYDSLPSQLRMVSLQRTPQ